MSYVAPQVNRRKLPTPGLRRPVTVCIAAIRKPSDLCPSIILVSDKEIGLGHVAGELADKQHFLWLDWHMLIAGEDVTTAIDIRRYASTALRNLAKAKEPISLDRVITVVKDAVFKRRSEIVESLVLHPLGWTLDEFKARARDLPETAYTLLLNKMGMFEPPPIELLIAGFASGWPHIFTIDWSGIARVHDDLGFYAIGSGADNALTMLFYRQYHSSMTLGEALYFAFEAKAAGEAAPNVGKETKLMTFIPGTFGTIASDEDIGQLRGVYEQLKPRPLIAQQQKLLSELRVVTETQAKWRERLEREMVKA